MLVGKQLNARDEFRMTLGSYYKKERDRAEQCLADIIDIFGNSDDEPSQVASVLARLTEHYALTHPDC